MNPVKCEQCGGINQPDAPPPWACRFCGAAMAAPELPENRIWLTDMAVHSLVASRLAGVNGTSIHPSIPENKVENARQVHAAHLPPGEHMLAVHDGTASDGASEGFVITSRRICWMHTTKGAMSLAWSQIDPEEIYADDGTLVLGRARLDTCFSDDDSGIWAWTEVLEILARSADPYDPSTDDEEDVERTRVSDPGWGGADVAVDDRPQSGDWTEGLDVHTDVTKVEHLGGAPYQSDDSVSVVDVHPSGELFVVAGSSTVELKYASNSQRLLAFPTPGSVLSARFSPDGRWLLVACTDRRVYLHDVQTAQRRGATEKMGDYCDEVVWLGATRFAAASQQGELWIVDATTMQIAAQVLEPDAEHNHLGGLAALPDGSRVFVAVGDRMGAFDTATGRIVWRLDDAPLYAPRLAMSPRGDALVAASADGVMFIDARTGQPRARQRFECPRGVSWPESGFLDSSRTNNDYPEWSWSPRPAFSPLGDVVAVQNPVGNLCFLDKATGALQATPRQLGCAWIEALAWFPDGNHLLLGMSDNTVAIWSARPMDNRLHGAGIGELPPEAYADLPTDDDATELDGAELEEVG